MSTYQPNIPTGLVDLDTDYLNLQRNFSQINTTYGTDHVPLTSGTLNGYHSVVHLVPFSTTTSNPPNNQPITAPTNVPAAGEVFSAQINDGINTDEALYYQSGSGKITQLTRNFQPSIGVSGGGFAGSTFLPGGLILQYGRFSATLVNGLTTFSLSGSINFATDNINFPNQCFNVFFGYDQASSSVNLDMYTNSISGTSFTYTGRGTKSSSTVGTLTVFWVALGN